MYLRPGEPIHGVGADFEGQLPPIQHLVKAEKKINWLCHLTSKEKYKHLRKNELLAADCSFKTN
jgi:hypothetical protein